METPIISAVNKDRFAQEIGIELVTVSAGYAKTRMTIEPRHLNGLDLGHGGTIFTLADYAFAAASNSHGVDAVAINITMSYFKAARAGDVLTAEAKDIALSRKIGTYAISVFNQHQDTVAFMQGTAFRKTV